MTFKLKHKIDWNNLEVNVRNFKNKEQLKEFIKGLKMDWE